MEVISLVKTDASAIYRQLFNDRPMSLRQLVQMKKKTQSKPRSRYALKHCEFNMKFVCPQKEGYARRSYFASKTDVLAIKIPPLYHRSFPSE